MQGLCLNHLTYSLIMKRSTVFSTGLTVATFFASSSYAALMTTPVQTVAFGDFNASES